MSEAEWSSPGFAAVADLIARRAGLIFPQLRVLAAEEAIQQSMVRRGARGLFDYVAVLEREPEERDLLLSELTIGETYFLRDRAQIELLRETILPNLLHGSTNRLRLWSAACASGEEAYSMAITSNELGVLHRVQIHGTDISRPRLAAAQAATYTRWSLRGVPEEVVRQYFTVKGKSFILSEQIRAAVDFSYLNLAEDTFPSFNSGVYAMDVIFCRNVLIYFDSATIARVAKRLMDSLTPSGWLVVGASDPMISEYVDCEVEVTSAGLAYRPRSAPRAVRAPALPAPTLDPGFGAPVKEKPPAAEERVARQPAAPAKVVRVASAPGVPPLVFQPADHVRDLANAGRLEDAAQVCADALDIKPSAELLYLHAILLTEANRPVEAAQAARKALYLDRSYVVAYLALAQASLRSGDAPGAIRAYRNAADLLSVLSDDTAVPGSGAETAARLRELVRVQLELLRGVAA